MGCIFFSLVNIRPKFRSQLKLIFVTCVAKTWNGFRFKPFVDSMKLLSENGLTVSIHGKDHHFNVGLLAFLADTLGAHTIGGFKESMSFSHRICRSCMATTEQIQTNFLESDF